jgi:hypothetical protein
VLRGAGAEELLLAPDRHSAAAAVPAVANMVGEDEAEKGEDGVYACDMVFDPLWDADCVTRLTEDACGALEPPPEAPPGWGVLDALLESM